MVGAWVGGYFLIIDARLKARMKQILFIAFLLVCLVVVMKVEDGCRSEKFRDLRTRELTNHIAGEITKVSYSSRIFY